MVPEKRTHVNVGTKLREVPVWGGEFVNELEWKRVLGQRSSVRTKTPRTTYSNHILSELAAMRQELQRREDRMMELDEQIAATRLALDQAYDVARRQILGAGGTGSKGKSGR